MTLHIASNSPDSKISLDVRTWRLDVQLSSLLAIICFVSFSVIFYESWKTPLHVLAACLIQIPVGLATGFGPVYMHKAIIGWHAFQFFNHIFKIIAWITISAAYLLSLVILIYTEFVEFAPYTVWVAFLGVGIYEASEYNPGIINTLNKMKKKRKE